MGYPYPISRGDSRPLGATVRPDGVNFSIYAESADFVELLLFDRYDDPWPRQVVRMEGRHHRNYNYWHAMVHGVGAGQIYGYRVHAARDPADGRYADPQKVLLDPYSRGVVYADNWSRDAARLPGDNTASSMKSLVVDTDAFDWEGVEPPRIDPTQRVIYEMHVGGFTRHATSHTSHPGTFDALVEKIPYLKELGVTTVELLPVFQFDEDAPIFRNPDTDEKLVDYWGYNPIGFFAPHRGYYTEDWSQMRYLTGFRDMVKAFHQAGIEVFLDVVFNHTTEGGADGPTISFRGIESRAYYMHDPKDPSRYQDYSGCGNTVNCNHPVVRRLILDSLRYWADVMHVDGFRFDLAAILSRDEDGEPLEAPPLTWEIESHPLLERTVLIAEAWDAAGLFQVGAFPGERWAEWNGFFRDDVRRFWRGEHGMLPGLSKRMLGSPDLYEEKGRTPLQCINFVTCHDGFTLNDLVSYTEKHNRENGEQNRDGANDNYSANYGIEGPTDDYEIESLRNRQVKNFIATLFLAQGTPMMLAGDEIRRTQHGNNNAWCQDNATSWVDWSLLEEHHDIHAFTRHLIRFRKRHPSLRRARFLLGYDAPANADPAGFTRVRWFGSDGGEPRWDNGARTLSYLLTEADDDVAIYVMMNAHDGAVEFTLPTLPGDTHWLLTIDTDADDHHDASLPGEERQIHGDRVWLQPRSLAVAIQSPGWKPPRARPW